MVSASVYPSVSIPLYDISRNDFVNQNYQVPINDGSNMGTESLYPPSLNEVPAPNYQYPLPSSSQQPNNVAYFQPPQMGLTQPFPTGAIIYNGKIIPTFQPYTRFAHLQAQFISVPNLASSSSTPLQYGLTPCPVPLNNKVHKANPRRKPKEKCATENAKQSAKRALLIGKQLRRKRGPNKRPAGTAFSNLLDGLPEEVRDGLDQYYPNCCEAVNTKDVSTKQKHVFSRRHCRNIPQEHQAVIPHFICPAIVAFNTNCKAKPGRYDSADRHTKNCVGFHQMNVNRIKKVDPVVITRSQYSLIESYFKDLTALRVQEVGATTKPTEQSTKELIEKADNLRVARTSILQDLFKDGIPDWIPEFNLQDVLAPADPTDAQIPIDATSMSPVPVANHVPQPSLSSEPSLFDPERAEECAEGFKNGCSVIDDSSAIMLTSAQPYATSVPGPMANHFEQIPLYDPSQFDLPDECVGAVPVANHSEQEQHSFYEPQLVGLENVGDAWAPFADFWQN